MLRFPNPESFVQYVRQSRRGSDNSILIVEGITDKRAMLPLLDSSVTVIPADGKDKLIAAFDGLSSRYQERIAFVLDCDGDTPGRLKGHGNLVLTTNRDVEADLLLEVRAFRGLAFELLAHLYDDIPSIEAAADAIVLDSSRLASKFGATRNASATLGLRQKLQDPHSGRKRPVRPSDLPGIAHMAGDVERVHATHLAAEIGGVLDWSPEEQRQVATLTAQELERPCSHHASRPCGPCTTRRHCGGHSLVDTLPAVIAARHGLNIDAAVLDRGLRIAAPSSELQSWRVLERLRRWEDASGSPLLRNRGMG